MRNLAGKKIRLKPIAAVCVLAFAVRAQAQNRGVYPLGMSATNSGVTPSAGFTTSTNFSSTPGITLRTMPAIRCRSRVKTTFSWT